MSLITGAVKPQYICQTCRAQATRQFHVTRAATAELPFWRRMKDRFMPDEKEQQAEQTREVQREEASRERAEAEAQRSTLETRRDRQGRTYEVAAFVDEKVNKNYVAATTWDGLESVGSEEWVKARLDEGYEYTGFAPQKRTRLSNVAWQQLLVTLWTHAMEQQAAGKIPAEMTSPYTQDQMASLSRSEHVDPESLAQMTNQSLSDPAVKLSIVKSAMQLTGTRIPDPTISNAKSLLDLYEALRKKEKPKKLADAPQLRKLKTSAPNVTVWGTRTTPIHKEKEVGRWKVIEEELTARDLPVTGSRYVDGKLFVRH